MSEAYQKGVVLLEGVKELVEDVLFALLAASHIRVHRGVVVALEVLNVHNTASVAVEALESMINKALAAIIHLTYYLPEELIIVDRPRVVSIKEREDAGHLGGFRGENSVVLHGLTELSKGKCL